MAGAADEMSCSVRPEGGKGDDAGVLETVARIGVKLSSEGGGEVVVVASLLELQRVRMTFEALEATKIGRAVNALRKNAPSEQARRLAAALYRGWKALDDESLRSSRAQQQQPKDDDEGIKNSSSLLPQPSPPVDLKMAGPEGDREIAPTSVVEKAAPEANSGGGRGGPAGAMAPPNVRCKN